MCILVWLNKDRGQHDEVFKLLEGILVIFSPSPHLSLLCELMEGFGNMQEVLDEASVEVVEAHK